MSAATPAAPASAAPAVPSSGAQTGHTLKPRPVSAAAESWKRLGFGFGRRFLFLLVIGLIWIAPAFRDRRFLLGMFAWDALLLIGWALDLAGMPHPRRLTITRSFSAPLALLVENQVELLIENASRATLLVAITDDLPTTLRESPAQLAITAPHGEIVAHYALRPSRRGDSTCGFAYLRMQTPLALAERWARADLRQTVRVYPNLKEAERNSLYLMRSRQIEMEKRFLRIRGEGREFESLREYQEGDDLRDICWTASARRAKPITRIYRIERSQPVWIVIDCGRLMRTRVGENTKLDSAVNAALSLAQVAIFSGDRVGLMAYGRSIRAMVPLGRGSAHLRRIIEQLAVIREETPEADHLRAGGALLTRQRRRALIIWLTDFPETSMMPEVLQGAMKMVPPHLLLFVAVSQPDLRELAARPPAKTDAMFEVAAAQELVNRREHLLAALRERGALALEADWRTLSTTLVNEYLNLKDKSKI